MTGESSKANSFQTFSGMGSGPSDLFDLMPLRALYYHTCKLLLRVNCCYLLLLHDPLFLLRQTRVLTICFCLFVCFFLKQITVMVLVSLFLILLIGGEPDPGQQEWTLSRENEHFSLDALSCWLDSVLPNKIFNVFIREGGLAYILRFR